MSNDPRADQDPQKAQSSGGVVEEPANSTVNDWLGQEVDRDQDLADRLVAESGGDTAKAERLFNEQSAHNEPEAVRSVPGDQRPT